MKIRYLLLILFALVLTEANAQKKKNKKSDDASMEMDKSPLNAGTFSGLKLRNLGPAFASGRIADIAIHPEDDNHWYVAVGSGGVWKTTNAGNTWTSLFDDQSVFSTGCVTIDPNNPSTIWVGTGENVGGRHVGFGDGIYRSMDSGKSWTNMGLKESQHISKIIVHPANSNVIWVAVQGPLWNKGGERGFYKSIDGGATWNKTLGDNEWTGVTDIAIDPRNPDLLYAATWQRHRTVAAYMGGGPKSGIHRSYDGGETWEELKGGIPAGNKGKIGLTISPQQPDIVYAAIELNRTKGGLYKSMDRGSSWTKQSDAVSGATGPHYYQELYASPHQFDRLYLMDVRIQVSDDGGKTFRVLQEEDKHSDNHVIAFKKGDPDYLLVGTDAGIYESFDLASNWRFFANLPLTQYYKVSVNDAKPFYHVFGGTQDNGSHGGPSRTDNQHGIRNGDWYKTLGADGHASYTEPGNPNIVYGEFQQGVTFRVDLKTGESVYIQPQAGEGEDYERFNWDAPILVSTHNPARVYVASQRVWKSENRGDSWTTISEDLSRNQERIALPIMGRVQSWDSPWDVGAMSNYNSITSLAESPIQEGLLYAGTDDGIIQVTEDGGSNWKKIEVGSIPGIPSTAFVNDIKADLFDANTVYVSLDNHKYGDLKPYFIKSTNKGSTWTSLTSGLPEKGMVWRTIQDHVKPNLLFLATEFGIYFTIDGGTNWIKLKGGSPTIAFRDLTIHRGENDLIGASFGRGFFVLDDYSVLREITEDKLNETAAIYPIKDALRYVPRNIASQQGTGEYIAENPTFGAVITYHLAEGLSDMASERKEAEKKIKDPNINIPFPGWDAIDAENAEEKAKLIVTIKDAQGKVINRIDAPAKKGLHRVAWDLRKMSQSGIRLGQGSGGRGFGNRGPMVTNGTYTATLSKIENGESTILAGPQSFNVVPLRSGTLNSGASDSEIIAFTGQLEDLQQKISAFNHVMSERMDKVKAMETAASRLDSDQPELLKSLYDMKKKMMAFDRKVNGSKAKSEIGERNNPSVRSRMFTAFRGLSTTYGPTETHKAALTLGVKEFGKMHDELETISSSAIPALEKQLISLGAPWIEGQPVPR